MALKCISRVKSLRVSKRLTFGSSESEEQQDFSRVAASLDMDNEEENTSLNFSPCRTRSGLVYDMETPDNKSDDLESLMPLPLSDFDCNLSPINKLQGKTIFPSTMSPKFKIHRRERTSTRIEDNSKIQKLKTCNISSLKTSNINPFSISPLISNRRKRNHSLSSVSSDDCDSDDSGRYSPVDMKRLRVSDLSISRYEEEFEELEDVACGEFGSVKLARHRLDGMDYAIKMSKTNIKAGSYEWKKALNEVFAHATLNNSEHVVRYYNSWVEDGQVFIQNEFCQGGSLADKIKDRRISGQNFSEDELKKILRQTLKGLQYIHSMHMAHLDVKPENIFISLQQSDSVVSSDCVEELEDPCNMMKQMDLHERMLPEDEYKYKLGDLGHVTQMHGGSLSPEEGDCRYMAPEFLWMDMDHSQLQKADIFSVGLTLYEAASLKTLPKNSLEDEEYIRLKAGQLPYLPEYSEHLNSILTSMVHYNPTNRPTASSLLTCLGQECY